MGKTSSQRIHCEEDLHFPLAHPLHMEVSRQIDYHYTR